MSSSEISETASAVLRMLPVSDKCVSNRQVDPIILNVTGWQPIPPDKVKELTFVQQQSNVSMERKSSDLLLALCKANVFNVAPYAAPIRAIVVSPSRTIGKQSNKVVMAGHTVKRHVHAVGCNASAAIENCTDFTSFRVTSLSFHFRNVSEGKRSSRPRNSSIPNPTLKHANCKEVS